MKTNKESELKMALYSIWRTGIRDEWIVCAGNWRSLDSRTITRFSLRITASVRKPASYWREKRDTIVILVRGFAIMLSCQNKPRTRLQFWHFSISKRRSVTSKKNN